MSGPGRHPATVGRPPLHDAYFSSPRWRESSRRSCARSEAELRKSHGGRGEGESSAAVALTRPKGERRKLRPLAWQNNWRPAGGFSSAPAVTCHQACKPGSVSRLAAGDGHSSWAQLTLAPRATNPGGSSGRDWRVSPPRRPYSVLLPVGFAVPPLLPETRCALTAPFHPYLAIAA